jgi:filamentous hemagglutinin family protein
MVRGVRPSSGIRRSFGLERSLDARRYLLTTAAALTPRAAGLVTVAVLAATPLLAVPAMAGPNGGTVVGGSATIQGQGSAAVTINQASQNAIINWQTFNIGQGETTTFNQPNSASTALNRVIGGQGPSFLDGTLTANGRVFIVNGDGILFGAHSSINTAGFLATTNDIRNDDFMAGKYNFNIPGLPNASIVIWEVSRPTRAASQPWWRQACATPAPSRRRSAP